MNYIYLTLVLNLIMLPGFAEVKDIQGSGACLDRSKYRAKKCAKEISIKNARGKCNGRITGRINTSYVQCERYYDRVWPNYWLGFMCAYNANAKCDSIPAPVVPKKDYEEIISAEEIVRANGCSVTNIFGSIARAAIEFEYSVNQTIEARKEGVLISSYTKVVNKEFFSIEQLSITYADDEDKLLELALKRCNQIRDGFLGLK